MDFRRYSLFIADLVEEISEADVETYFKEKLGEHISVKAKIIRNHSTAMRPLRYGYLNFGTSEDAENALTKLNYQSIKGTTPYRLMYVQTDSTLRRSGVGNVIVKGLPESYQTAQLHDLFSEFGTIISCKISPYVRTGEGAHGYVHFQTKEEADKAIAKHNGTTVEDRTLVVAHFVKAPTHVVDHVFTIGFPAEATEADLRTVFSRAGTITKIMIHDRSKRNPGADPRKSGSRFAFVWYEKTEEVHRAVEKLNKVSWLALIQDQKETDPNSTGPKLTVEVAIPQAEQARRRQQRKEQTRFRNLYVRGFPATFDDKDFKRLFEPFGEIVSCRVMRSDTGTSRQFGFCCFALDEEARKAYLSLNEHKPEGFDTALTVNYAESKEERARQRLARQHQKQHMMMQTYMSQFGPGMPNPMMMHQRGPMNQPGMPMQQPGGPQPMNQMPLVGPAPGAPHPAMRVPFMAPGQQPMNMLPFPQQPFMMPFPGMPVNQSYTGPALRQQDRRRPQRPPQMASEAPLLMHHDTRYVPQNVVAPGPGGPGMLPIPNAVPAAAQPPIVQPTPTVPQHAIQLDPVLAKLHEMSVDDQKQHLGEQLFPKIQLVDSINAGKITGMLLELDTNELVRLYQNPAELRAKVEEAKNVLRDAGVQ